MDEEPSVEQQAKALEKVSQIAAMAEFNLQRHPDDEMLVAGFEMGAGRRQVVYIRYAGQTPDGHDSVTFMSPCMEVKKRGLFGAGMSGRRAVDLLRRNACLLFGSFALYTFGDNQEVVMVVSNQIVDTMEVEEFRAHISAVALVADEFERECGSDVF